MVIPVRLKENGYPIVVERGAISRARELFSLDRKVLILTDEGVPRAYSAAIADACKQPYLEIVAEGETVKCLSVYERLQYRMLSEGFSRKDCVVSVGGGVISDLAGFVAATYMRGIDFYSVPTTVLSEVDASVGGKTALNFCGIKNVIGAFHQPKCVLIDPDTLQTLPARQISNGLAEAVKMALTCDAELFARFEQNDPFSDLDTILARSVEIKRDVVEQDEKENDLRRVLNFGHTIGHGIESAANGALYHGESVAVGMLPMCSESVRARLIPVLEKLHLPTSVQLDPEAVYGALLHDKKASAGSVSVVRVEEVGSFFMETVATEALRPLIASVVRKEPA